MSFSCKLVVCSVVPSNQLRDRSLVTTLATTRSRNGRFRSAPNPTVLSRSPKVLCGLLLPTDPWSPAVDSQSIASQLFAISLFPYLGFLYYITRSKTAPNLTLFGFYFLLAFVGATTKLKYGTSLANVDWLHGGAESLLTLTNLFIVLGLRGALRKLNDSKKDKAKSVSDVADKQSSV